MTLKDYIIIRTRFFDKKKIKFNHAAVNIFTSAIEVNILVKYKMQTVDLISFLF